MKQKVILLIFCCLCSLGAAAQGVVTRQKPKPTTTQQSKPRQNTQPRQKPKPTTPSKPRPATPLRQKPKPTTPARPHNSGTSQGTSTVSSGGSNKTFTVGGVSFTMVYVQGGTFTMGATREQGSDAYDSEKPSHSVTLSSYHIGETEVTQALWQAVMGSNPSKFTGDSRRPVEMVSWEDCQRFLSRLNSLTGQEFHLPTEAQWEYAARGGSMSRGYKYSGSNDVGSVAWYHDNSSRTTHPVKTKSPNELGLYDMSGNVFEWCQDWYGFYSSGSQTNPTGASSGSCRVGRGGSWNYVARVCRVSNRNNYTPSYRSFNLGLRLAL